MFNLLQKIRVPSGSFKFSIMPRKNRSSFSRYKIFARLCFNAVAGSRPRFGVFALFDPEWYLSSNPDVAERGINPLAHFLKHGLLEGRNPHPLFDTDWYLERNPDVAAAGVNPLVHFITSGAREGRDPHPLFDIHWYVETNPDVAAAGVNPLMHFIRAGAREGRDPHPLFDTHWYLETNAGVAATRGNPLLHFIRSGAREGRDPHPLFDTDWYLERYPDVAAAGINPLVHFITSGARERRSPHPLFDTSWYLETNPDVADAQVNPLVHYLRSGASEGRSPSPDFDTNWYVSQYPDVAATAINPLVHYVLTGVHEGRVPHAKIKARERLDGAIARYEETGELNAETTLRLRRDDAGTTALGFLLPNQPLNVFVDPSLSSTPTLRILLPSLQMRYATGGPNTAYILGMLLANDGIPVIFVSTDLPLDDNLNGIKSHLHRLTGLRPDDLAVQFIDGSDRTQPLAIGYNDALMATAWWTAHAARSATSMLRCKRIYYLVQDYETLFYGASENFADAEASYSFDHVPIINTSLLRDHLISRAVGRYSNADFSRQAIAFEPAIDQSYFRPENRDAQAPRRLLFYARPNIAKRNLFGLGIAVLRAAVEKGLFGDSGWEFIGMGESFDPIPLGRGYTLTPAEWLDFEGYAEQMRGTDILLSSMLSPHPSYPPLEMAACGGLAVTTVFGSKTAARLSALSPNLIGAEPEIGDMLLALARARALSDDKGRRQTAPQLSLPRTWTESLSPAVETLVAQLQRDGISRRGTLPKLARPVSVVRANDIIEDSPTFYHRRAQLRRKRYVEGDTPGLLSLVTTVYDTDPSFLTDLAHTVFGQDTTADFEWLILDNGSTRLETREVLNEIALDRRVRLGRAEQNLGIVGGMRWCLERAQGRYIVPVDSDDLLFPDCVRTLSSFLEQAGMPLVVYTDEDKTDGYNHRDAYLKPEWDPVLFVHSCFIAHLTVIDRKTALELGCYSDPATEGCHDWDTFIRFFNAGQEPAHIPEVLYSWRMHHASTSSNYRAKPYIYQSHKAALERFLDARGKLDKYEIVLSPLFDGTPDYRFKRRRARTGDSQNAVRVNNDIIATVMLDQSVSRDGLRAAIGHVDPNVRYIHLQSRKCDLIEGEFAEEVLTHFDLFPDSAVVGGRIQDGEIIRESGYVFGYGGSIGCPESGNALTSSGYFAQGWKPRSVAAVSARHSVVSRAFLTENLDKLPVELSLTMLGPWLGALACLAGLRVIYTPLISAKLGAGEEIALSHEELAGFTGAFSSLMRNPVGYAHHLDRSGQRAYQPAEVGTPLIRLPYANFFTQHVEQRFAALAPRLTDDLPTISVLTTVYERTDTKLFRATAEAMRAQRHKASEWIVLAHGPIPADLDKTLVAFEAEGLLRTLRHEVNLGIHGGLRVCLEHAIGDFAISMDADDLLTPDALAILANAAKSNPNRAIFYSDEDLLIEDAFCHPYYRPDFDPALLFAQSYIWHAILFQRQLALALGVFTSSEAEYAQDWDTLVRFAEGGHEPLHIPEVLYHWRQHPSSLSNSGNSFSGSARSIQAVLRGVAQRRRQDLYEVAPYPFDLGIQDYYLRRLQKEPASVDLISIGLDARGPEHFPFATRQVAPPLRGLSGIAVLLDLLEHSESEFAMLVGPSTVAIESQAVWDSLKHFELISNVVAVTGPLVDASGKVLRGSLVLRDREQLCDPIAGRAMNDPCSGSLGLKPHCVDGVSVDLLIGRRRFLVDALKAAPGNLATRSLGAWLGSFASGTERLMVYEPLLRAFVKNENDLIGDGISGLQTTWAHLLAARAPCNVPARGLAGFVRHSDMHE
ncbi:glycosyltransferase [Paraburkholderia phymatum]|uniref:rhamnosyltransferase WsaF family glycosyltransferase n=1 Tax=Paraburkholderia phymatum TaxID=148447 RepID=UPI0031765A0F